jgi:site-specific DNA-methyltransferase (adenine-specific)
MQPYYDHNGITIYHGDCREVLPRLAERPRLVLADPPYGDDHDTDYTRFSGGRKDSQGAELERYAYQAVANDVEPFDPAPLLAIGAECILFGANRYSDRLPCGSWLIWDKRTPTGSKGVMSDAEVAWWSKGRGVYIFEHTWDGFNRASERGSRFHPTQKPVALMRWCLQRAGLKPGDLVLDPYMGSGPVARACMDLGIRYIGIELEADYCEAAARRLAQSVLDLSEAA